MQPGAQAGSWDRQQGLQTRDFNSKDGKLDPAPFPTLLITDLAMSLSARSARLRAAEPRGQGPARTELQIQQGMHTEVNRTVLSWEKCSEGNRWGGGE